MTTIYYFIGILFLLYEISELINIQKAHYNLMGFKAFLKENKDLKIEDYPKDQKKDYLKGILIVIVPLIIWLFTGLLTSQWFIFLALLLVDFVIFGIIRKIVGVGVLRLYLHIVVNLTYITAITFILVNKFHLHLTFEQVLEWFK